MTGIWKRCAETLFVALITVAFASHATYAGKGNGKGNGGGGNDPPQISPAPGYIYYTHAGTMEMEGNGDNKITINGLEVDHTASRLLYGGGYRWMLFTEQTGVYDEARDQQGNVIANNVAHYDLFARRPVFDGNGNVVDEEVIQLTDTYGTFNIWWWTSVPQRWAKNDSFISSKVEDMRAAFGVEPDGTTYYISDLKTQAVAKLDIAGIDIVAGFIPIDDTGVQRVIGTEIGVNSQIRHENNWTHDFSADGTKLVYTYKIDESTSDDFYVYDLVTDTSVLVYDNTDQLGQTRDPYMSPTGTKVLFQYQGNVYEANSDGSGVDFIVAGVSPFYSPGGEFLAFLEIAGKGKPNYRIKRLEFATGDVVDLTSDVNSKEQKTLIEWLSDEFAQ